MVLMTYHNPLQGVSFQVVGVAADEQTAKEALRHYYAGIPSAWEEILTANDYTLVRWIDKGSGHCYMIQEVQVFGSP